MLVFFFFFLMLCLFFVFFLMLCLFFGNLLLPFYISDGLPVEDRSILSTARCTDPG